jgi:hypothetical protein
MDLLRAADFEGVVVYWTDNYSSARIKRGPLGSYYFAIELEGKTLQASIPTAVASTTISTEMTRRLYGFDETSKDI